MSTRVLVVDDHAVFREGLRALLARAEDVDVVGEAATTQAAVDAARALRPDVVLMDLNLPGDGGVEATRQVLAADPDVAVLVLTMHDDDASIGAALRAGARGYLLKDAEPESIIRAISAVAAGQVILDPGAVGFLAAAAAATASGEPFPSLTPREREILDRVARGLRNDAIAARMGLSTKTVQNNVSTLLVKLGARDRAQLVAMARDQGLGGSF